MQEFGWSLKWCKIKKRCKSVCVWYPFAQVAGEDEIAGEGGGERRVEVEHF